LKTFLNLKNEQISKLPEEFRDDDVRYTEALVEHFLHEFTKEGDVVFDPFMGFATTLLVAEKLNRCAYGVEFDERRWRYVQSILKYPHRALHGDSTKLAHLEIPDVDFSVTSPPYMGKNHVENPFTAYSTIGKGYREYLQTMQLIYKQLNDKLKPSATAIIEVSNLKHEDGSITTLAWDIAAEVSKVLRFRGEVIVTWEETYGFGYDHSYCLVFEKL
jgi:DNA modification methylase